MFLYLQVYNQVLKYYNQALEEQQIKNEIEDKIEGETEEFLWRM